MLFRSMGEQKRGGRGEGAKGYRENERNGKLTNIFAYTHYISCSDCELSDGESFVRDKSGVNKIFD